MKNHLFCFVQKMQMKNHLLNIGILAVLIFIGSPGCKPSPSPLILTEQSHAELTPYADTRIDTLNHIIETYWRN